MTKFSRILSEVETKEEILPGGIIRVDFGDIIEYTKNGLLHRLDGPAVIDKHHDIVEYWVNGKRHRIDGPAVINNESEYESYWVNGKELTKEEFDKHFGEE